MEQAGNILAFNIPGTLFRNVPRNIIGNFFWIYEEYLMGMFRTYSTIIHLPGGKDFFPLISFSVWIRNKTPGKTSCKTNIRKPIHKILGNTSGVKHRSLGFSSWWLFSDLLLQLCHHYFINCFQYEWMERQCKNCKMNIKSDNSRTFINHMENHMENHF